MSELTDYYKKYPWRKTLVVIKQRCSNPKNSSYKDYGGRGIQCLITSEELKELWLRDKAYAMSQPTIDRIDNDGNYASSNCRYIEKRLNTVERNQRVCSKPIKQYSLTGKLLKKWKSLTEAARSLGIDKAAISKCALGQVKTSCKCIWKY
jgi:hypothetical protein